MADLLFSSSNLSDEQASLNRKIAYYYMHKVTIGSFQLGVSWFSLSNSALTNENTFFEDFVINQKYQLTGERNRLLDLKSLTTNQLGSLLALNEDSIYYNCNTLDSDDILIYLKIKGGEQETTSVFSLKKLFAIFGIILACSQGVQAFIHKLLGITPPHNNNADYPKPGKPGQDLRTTNPCEYNARGSSYRTTYLRGRRKSNYEVPAFEKLTFEEYDTYIQCQRKYPLTGLQERMLPSKNDNYVKLKGTSINNENISGFKVRIAWGQSQKGGKDIRHGYIFDLEPKLDSNNKPIMKVNGKDPDYPVPTPVSKTGQQEAWHRAQTTFCRKYNNRNFEVKTNINYMPNHDGTFGRGGFSKGLVIFDRENNIMCVARPDNPNELNPKSFTIVTTFNPSPNEIKYYDVFSIVIPADKKSYRDLNNKINIMNSCSASQIEEFSSIQQEEQGQCSIPDIEIINPEVLTNETKTD